MKKFLVLGLMLFGFSTLFAIEYVKVASYQGVVVENTTVNADKSITIDFKNSSPCEIPEIATYTFEYYLSFKGKRISDYYNAAVRCKGHKTYTVYFWPDTVKAGQEKYITVQFGREQPKRDPRDDY